MDKPTGVNVDVIATSCIAVRLRLLNRVISNLYDEALRPLGMKISQLNVLVVAAKLGVAQPAKVCDLLQLDASTLCRNVERMRMNEKGKGKGWLEVVPGEDGRTQPFRLTAKGEAILERAMTAWEQAQQQASEILGESGVALLANATRKLGLLRAKR